MTTTEGAVAADSLQDQAGKLTQMVRAFRLRREASDAQAEHAHALAVRMLR